MPKFCASLKESFPLKVEKAGSVVFASPLCWLLAPAKMA